MIGTPNISDAGHQNKRRLQEADQHIGRDLAEHDLERRDRHRQQALHGAALDLARDRKAVKISMVKVRMVPSRPGHDVERRRGRRVVAVVRADLEQRLAGVGQAAIVARAPW